MKLAAIASLALALAGCTLPMLSFVDLDATGTTDATDDLAVATDGGDASSADADAGPPLVVVQLAAGAAHACVVLGTAIGTPGTQLVCWGLNSNGELGIAPTAPMQPLAPTRVPLPAEVASIASIALAGSHSCGLFNLADGTQRAYCWGANDSGQTGRRDSADAGAQPIEAVDLPDNADAGLVGHPGVPGPQFGYIAANARTTCVTYNSQVYCWGDNSFQKVTGCASTESCFVSGTTNFFAPHLVSHVVGPFESIAVGPFDVCANVTTAGGAQIQCWGADGVGQIGNNTMTTSSIATVATAASVLPNTVGVVTAGENYQCALDHGTAYCWGTNALGVTGNGMSSGDVRVPTPVTSMDSIVAGRISAHYEHTCAIAQNNLAVQCWGSNAFGQLGGANSTGCMACSDVATTVAGLPTDGQFDLVAVGAAFSCVHNAHDDSVWCWGADGDLQLGRPIGLSTPLPVQLPPR